MQRTASWTLTNFAWPSEQIPPVASRTRSMADLEDNLDEAEKAFESQYAPQAKTGESAVHL